MGVPSDSFVGLEPGPHTLSAVAVYADGTTAQRSVAFDYQPLTTVALGWDHDIRPIHEARCAKCHTSGPGRPLSSYELWKENAPLIVAAVREQRMPADGPWTRNSSPSSSAGRPPARIPDRGVPP